MSTEGEVTEPLPVHPDAKHMGVFLEEVGYFLEDMKKDLWWLLRAAHQPSGKVFFCGDEELEDIPAEKENIISVLKQRFTLHAEAHEGQVRAKIAVIPSVTPEEMEVLKCLSNLKFNCHGLVSVFPCMKEANNAALWGAYHVYASGLQPQWIVPSDGAGQKSTFGQCSVVVPVYINPAKKEVKLLHVWCPEKKKRHWGFIGGDIIRGVDQNLYDAARREFQEELGMFFDRSWSECFQAELPANGDEPISDPRNLMFVSLEKDGVRYPCRPYFFAQVTEEFYDSSLAYEDKSGVIQLPQPKVDCVRWDDLEHATRVHLEGVAFVEHTEARWLNLDFETGRLWSDDNRQLRRDNVELMKPQPEKVWQWLASLLGCAAPERAPMLPADFDSAAPLAVRMSGIDKQATDEDIKEFFESGGIIRTTLVKQFENPKHTARVEFEDLKMLELALGLSGHSLQRRKVKVEIWTEGDSKGDPESGVRPLQEYTGELPEEGPFKIMVSGLDRTVDKDALGYFFWDRACMVKDVEFPLKQHRHAGFLELADQESLRKALGLNNAAFRGREITVELFHPSMATAPSSGGASGGRRDGDRRDKGGGKGGGKGKRDGGFSIDRDPPSRSEFGSERPKLNLKPRTVQGDDGGGPPPRSGFGGGFDDRGGGYENRGTEQRSSRPDPFGGARPRDDRFKATRADNDDNWRR